MSKADDDPEVIRLFASLGNPLSRHQTRWKFSLALIAGGVLVLAVCWRIESATLARGIGAAIGATAILLGFSSLLSQITSAEYWICPGGVIFVKYGKVAGWPWDQVAEISLIRRTTRVEGWSAGGGELSARLRNQSGARVELRTMSLREAAFVESNVRRSVMKRALGELGSGGVVAFGAITLRKDGIVQRNAVVVWEELDKVTLEHAIVLTLRDGTRRYLHNVPNAPAVAEIISNRLALGRFGEATAVVPS